MGKPIPWKVVDSFPGFSYHENAFKCEAANELVRHIEEEGRWTQDYERTAQYHGYVYLHRGRACVSPKLNLVTAMRWRRTSLGAGGCSIQEGSRELRPQAR